MSGSMQIPAHESGVLRLFAIHLPAAEIAGFSEAPYSDEDTEHWPLKDALGAAYLDHDFVEVINLDDLADFGLSRYLIEGGGIPKDQVTPMQTRLDAMRGHAVLVSSPAFKDAAQTLTPKAPLAHVATFFEDARPVTFDALPDEGAQKQALEADAPKPRKKPSDAAMSGRIATLALLVAFGVAAMMVWLA